MKFSSQPPVMNSRKDGRGTTEQACTRTVPECTYDAPLAFFLTSFTSGKGSPEADLIKHAPHGQQVAKPTGPRRLR